MNLIHEGRHYGQPLHLHKYLWVSHSHDVVSHNCETGGDMRPVSHESYVVAPPSPSPAAPEMRQLARKWELFVTGTDVDLSDMSPIIRDAWIRSKQAGVDPALPRASWQEIPNDPEDLREE